MRFIPQSNQLTIKLEGMEQLWALKRRLQIPQYAIEDVDFVPTQPTMQDFWGYVRLPGTSLPGRFLAGSFRRREDREFWYMHMHTPGLLTLYLKPGTLNYDKIRVTCTPEIAQDIADWWREQKTGLEK